MPMDVFHRFHESFREGRMCMNHFGYTGDRGTKMHRQGCFMDEISGMGAENVHTKNPVTLRIGHNLHQPLKIPPWLALSPTRRNGNVRL